MTTSSLPLLAFRPDAAIIDLDGTLVDTLGDFVAALNLALADLPWSGRALAPLAAQDVERRVGKGSEHLVRSVLDDLQAHAGPAPDGRPLTAMYDLALAGYQRHYERVNGKHSQVYPGAVQGLYALRQAGIPMACLTNKPLAFARELLALKGLAPFFGQVFGGDSFARKKPDPLPLLKTCEALGTRPARTLMVGDSSNDARAARAAGCPVVLVTYGYNHGEPVRAVDADGFVDSLAELAWPVAAHSART